jgi:hypothetical protein
VQWPAKPEKLQPQFRSLRQLLCRRLRLLLAVARRAAEGKMSRLLQ